MVLLLAAAAILGGCSTRERAGDAAGRPAPLPSPAETGEPGCFQIRDAQDFQVLDRSNLIIYAPTRSHAFHVRISPPSPDLRHAERLAFVARQDRICGYAGDSLVLGAAGGPRRYAISSVSRLSPEGRTSLLERARGPDGDLPEPLPTGSATVERELAPDDGGRD